MPNAKCVRCPNVGYTTNVRIPVAQHFGVEGDAVVETIILCSTCRAKGVEETGAAKLRSTGKDVRG